MHSYSLDRGYHRLYTRRMEKKIIDIKEETVSFHARKSFMESCGFDMGKSETSAMIHMADEVRSRMHNTINLKAVVTRFGQEVFEEGKVVIGDEEFKCNFFSQIPETAVEEIYFYVVTAGKCELKKQGDVKIMDQLFADIWGNAYVEAAAAEIKENVIEKEIKGRFPGMNVCLSDEFGPGYFGMPVSESGKFAEILDAEQIKVYVNENGLMMPPKTCTGMYLVLNRNDIKAENACIRCQGNPSGCRFCSVGR